jgi:hypothetical protein
VGRAYETLRVGQAGVEGYVWDVRLVREALPRASHDVRRRRDDGAEFKEAVLGSRSDVPELVDVASRFPHDGSISGQEGAAPEDDGFEA